MGQSKCISSAGRQAGTQQLQPLCAPSDRLPGAAHPHVVSLLREILYHEGAGGTQAAVETGICLPLSHYRTQASHAVALPATCL